MSDKMLHAMLDCESLGLRHTSVITTIGACQFDPYQPGAIGEHFHEAIDLQSAMNHGLTVDASTLLWWLEQAPVAQHALVTKLRAASSLSTALNAFSSFLSRCGSKAQVKVWSCGSRDFEWMESAYAAVGQQVPWGYRTGDYRTIRDEFGSPADAPESTTSHDALCDAIWQAKYLQNVFARLKLQEQDAEEIRRIRAGFLNQCLEHGQLQPGQGG